MNDLDEMSTELIRVIGTLPGEKVIELMDFARFLEAEYTRGSKSQIDIPSLILQQNALERIWNNSEEDIYMHDLEIK